MTLDILARKYRNKVILMHTVYLLLMYLFRCICISHRDRGPRLTCLLLCVQPNTLIYQFLFLSHKLHFSYILPDMFLLIGENLLTSSSFVLKTTIKGIYWNLYYKCFLCYNRYSISIAFTACVKNARLLMENIFDKLCIPLNFQLINKEPGHISMHLVGVVFFSIFSIC